MKSMKFAAAAASLSMIASMAAFVPMCAEAGTTYSGTLATEDELKTTTLDKYLVMKKDASVPNAEFTFTVAGIENKIAAENGKLAVLVPAGVPSLKIGTGTAETDGNINMAFSSDDTATNEASKPTDDAPVFKTNDTSDEKYVKKTLVLDFSGVTFSEPGGYRYIISETGGGQGITNGYTGTTPESESQRTLDVYVKDTGTTVTESGVKKPQLAIESYVMYNGALTDAPDAQLPTGADKDAVPNGAEVDGATKNSSITNLYSTQDLTFGKIVTGNQGSKDKYFKFTVVIDNIKSENTKMTVDRQLADEAVPAEPNSATKDEYAGKSNPEELIADITKTIADNGYTAVAKLNETDPTKTDCYTITAEFYLQHDQYITINGIPKDATYTISEDAEEYTSTEGIAEANSTLDVDKDNDPDPLNDDVSGSIDSEDIYTGFTNDRTGTIPTGLLSTVAGSAGLIAVGLVGVAGGAFYVKKKKSEDE